MIWFRLEKDQADLCCHIYCHGYRRKPTKSADPAPENLEHRMAVDVTFVETKYPNPETEHRQRILCQANLRSDYRVAKMVPRQAGPQEVKVRKEIAQVLLNKPQAQRPVFRGLKDVAGAQHPEECFGYACWPLLDGEKASRRIVRDEKVA